MQRLCFDLQTISMRGECIDIRINRLIQADNLGKVN